MSAASMVAVLFGGTAAALVGKALGVGWFYAEMIVSMLAYMAGWLDGRTKNGDGEK